MQHVAIIEPAHSHEEVILPQIELLQGSFKLSVIAPQSLLDVDLLSRTAHLYHPYAFRTVDARSRVRKGLGKLRNYFAIGEVIKQINPDVIIFNSTYSLPEVALIHCLFKKYRKIQIIHEFQKFLPAPARWLYQAFDVNLVISEQVHRYITKNHREFSDLDYFLPIFFDSFLVNGNCGGSLPQEPDPYLKLGVFGSIDDDRRNYRGLLDALRSLGIPLEKARFRVYLVGKSPLGVQAYINKHNLQGAVEYYTEFVSFRKMFDLFNEMDIVLFLIDRDVKTYRNYNRYKISGTSSLIKAFRKAGAASTDFLVDASLSDKCFYYDGTDIKSLLRQIDEGHITAEDVRLKTEKYDQERMFSFVSQQARLVSALQRACS